MPSSKPVRLALGKSSTYYRALLAEQEVTLIHNADKLLEQIRSGEFGKREVEVGHVNQ